MQKKKRLRQVVDSDLAADYSSDDEEDSPDYPLAMATPRPLIPPASVGRSMHHHNDPLRLAMAAAIILVVVVVAGIIIANWHDVAVYGIWILLGLITTGAGVVVLLAVGRYRDGEADRRIKNAHAQRLESTRPFDQNGNLYLVDKGYIPGQAPQFPELRTYHNSPRVTGIKDDMPQLEAPAPQYDRPRVETFYEIIPYNSLQTGLGIEAANGKHVLAPIVKSTHFKFIGGSGQGKSCVAGAVLDIATTTNDPAHLQIGLLDLEHNTSRLFEDLPHVAEIGPKKQRLVGRDPDEVAQKLKLLQWELTRRANLGEAYCMKHELLLLVYVEEMLALKYEVIDKKLNKQMLAAINILGVRGRKYGIYLLACMQTDYSDKSTREGLAMFRTRGGFAIDPDTARASGFHNTELIKENFQRGQSGTYVLEKPQYSGLVLAPEYDVTSKLMRLDAPTTRVTTRVTTSMPDYPLQGELGSGAGSDAVVTGDLSLPAASQASFGTLTPQEKRILQKFRSGMGTKKIISSEFTDASGKPLEGGREFTKKANEIQQLIARFIPVEEGE